MFEAEPVYPFLIFIRNGQALAGNLHGRGIFAPLKKVHVAHFLTLQ
jgi:hypothetical protein